MLTSRRSRLALAALVLAVPLTARAAAGDVAAWDRELFHLLYSGESPAPDGALPRNGWLLVLAIRAGTHLASIPLILAGVAAVAALLVWRGRRREAVFLLLAVVPLGPLSRGIEELVGRASPFPLPGVSAFPSGHAMVSLAFAAAVVAVWPWPGRAVLTALAVPAVLAVGATVVADGGHWPSDVLAGWLLATAWVATLHRLLWPPGAAFSGRPAPDGG